ncbi:MAG TPA: Trp family transcriptional regulator [Elusimicrobiales bacterium]|nr:Trp family transcriptional regulator [Elusimicrobiales bacterium]
MHRNTGANHDLAEIISGLRGLRSDSDALKLARELFTPAEIEDFSMRWRLLKLLESGLPQRKIASALGISLCKITRGSRILKKKDSKAKTTLRRFIK